MQQYFYDVITRSARVRNGHESKRAEPSFLGLEGPRNWSDEKGDCLGFEAQRFLIDQHAPFICICIAVAFALFSCRFGAVQAKFGNLVKVGILSALQRTFCYFSDQVHQ